MKNTPAVLLFAIAALFSHVERAHACSIAGGTAVPFASFPKDGATDVPLNATPFVRGEGRDGFVALEDIALIGPDDAPVAATLASTTVVDGAGPMHLIQVLPAAELTPFSSYRIVHRDGEIGTFTTGDAVDDAPPALSDARVLSTHPADNTDPGWFGMHTVSSCGFPASASLAAGRSEPSILLATLDANAALSAPMVQATLESEVFVQFRGQATVTLFAVDMAGNLSAAESLDVEEPAAESCAQTGAGGASVFSLLLVAVRGFGRRLRGQTGRGNVKR